MPKSSKINNLGKSIIRITVPLVLMVLSVYIVIARPVPVIQELDLLNVSVSAESLKNHVIYLSETEAPRDVNNAENLKNVASYIEEEFLKSSKNVSLQKFNYGKDEYHNVIAKFGNLKSNDLIIIGAHYDAYSDLPGADDNASGVAGLLELSKLLVKTNLNKQIQLVAYTLEDPPFFATEYMGSYIHAKSVKDKNVELMISLEMIGYFSDEEGSQMYPLKAMNLFYPNKGNYIAVVD